MHDVRKSEYPWHIDTINITSLVYTTQSIHTTILNKILANAWKWNLNKHNLVPRVLVTLVQRWSGQHDRDSRTSGSTAHVFDPMFQLTDAKILGLTVLLRKSGGSLEPRGPCWPLHKGNKDSGNEIGTNTNRPLLSSFYTVQNESWYTTFHMKTKFILAFHFMQIKHIFISLVTHQDLDLKQRQKATRKWPCIKL